MLEACGGDGGELQLTEVARMTGLPKSSAHRIISQLVDCGMLERVGDHFRIGTHMFELGARSAHSRVLRQWAMPFLVELYERTHETVHLGTRAGREVLYIEKICGRRRAPAPVTTGVGARLPLPCTAMGKLILAFSPRGLVLDVIAHGWDRRTPHTITDPDALQRELAAVAQDGIAFDRQESHVGAACVAAPIFRPDGVLVAALSVTGPVTRFDPGQVAPSARLCAVAISRALARVGASRPGLTLVAGGHGAP